MDWADVVVSALPWLEGIVDFADVVVTAIPNFGRTPLLLALTAFGTLFFVFKEA